MAKNEDTENKDNGSDVGTKPASAMTPQEHSANMKKIFDKQAKVPVFIPLDGDRAGSTLPVCINDYTVHIPKGRMINVPEGIAMIVMEHLQATSQAIQDAQSLMKNPEDLVL